MRSASSAKEREGVYEGSELVSRRAYSNSEPARWWRDHNYSAAWRSLSVRYSNFLYVFLLCALSATERRGLFLFVERVFGGAVWQRCSQYVLSMVQCLKRLSCSSLAVAPSPFSCGVCSSCLCLLAVVFYGCAFFHFSPSAHATRAALSNPLYLRSLPLFVLLLRLFRCRFSIFCTFLLAPSPSLSRDVLLFTCSLPFSCVRLLPSVTPDVSDNSGPSPLFLFFLSSCGLTLFVLCCTLRCRPHETACKWPVTFCGFDSTCVAHTRTFLCCCCCTCTLLQTLLHYTRGARLCLQGRRSAASSAAGTPCARLLCVAEWCLSGHENAVHSRAHHCTCFVYSGFCQPRRCSGALGVDEHERNPSCCGLMKNAVTDRLDSVCSLSLSHSSLHPSSSPPFFLASAPHFPPQTEL